MKATHVIGGVYSASEVAQAYVWTDGRHEACSSLWQAPALCSRQQACSVGSFESLIGWCH